LSVLGGKKARGVRGRLSRVDAIPSKETGRMDQELIAYLDERFRETSQLIIQQVVQQVVPQVHAETREQVQGLRNEMHGLRKEMDERFKEVNDTTRQTLVIVEDLRDEIHLVAEAFLGTDERVKRLEDAGALSFEAVKGWVEPYFKSIDERGRELDASSVQLEVPVKDLNNRVSVLEGRATRRRKKVMKAVAEKVAGSKRSPTP
jgi:hypothetical protein